jgi:diguanylate cyclase (GGDEF)-like protein
VPISDENDQLCGTFCIFDQKPRQLSAADEGTLNDLAAIAQREIMSERMRSVHTSLTSKLGIARRESMMDPLTRLWNRRGASVMLKSALDDARGKRSYVGIAILDLDNFKQINDTFGHQIGDEVLRKTALRLIQNVRTEDSVCRIGGDEFLLIMKDSDSELARETTERIRQQVATTPVPTRAGEITISTSVGYAVRSGEDDISVEDLIQRADQALLKSKSLGRDQVIEIG